MFLPRGPLEYSGWGCDLSQTGWLRRAVLQESWPVNKLNRCVSIVTLMAVLFTQSGDTIAEEVQSAAQDTPRFPAAPSLSHSKPEETLDRHVRIERRHGVWRGRDQAAHQLL